MDTVKKSFDPIKKLTAVKVHSVLLIFSGVFCGLMQGAFDLPYLAFAAYAPLMHYLRTADGKFDFLIKFSEYYLPYYLTQIIFLVAARTAAPINQAAAFILLALAAAALTLWESLLTLIPLCFYFYLPHGRFADVISLSLLITAGEWLQEHIFILSFPWSGVWLSVTGSPLLMQSANLFGARFVSFIILLSAGLLSLIVTSRRRIAPLCAFAGAVITVSAYGSYSIQKNDMLSEKGKQLSVLCVQDNCEGTKKNDMTSLEAANSYKDIINEYDGDAQLILLPETAVPEDYDEEAEEFEIISDIAKSKNCIVVTGAFLKKDNSDYNAVIAFSPEDVSSPYCKQVLVPFGEKDPFAIFTGAETLCECSDKSAVKPIKSDGLTIGCVICVESIYSSLVQKQSTEGAEIICVSTNDSWFGKTFARNQHYRHSIMRAVESGKWLLRAGNCGISAIISPSGEVKAEFTENEKAYVSAQASLISESSFYSKTGDIFITLPTALIILSIIRKTKASRQNSSINRRAE